MKNRISILARFKQWILSIVICWLISRKFLWRKIVFDNGIIGKNYNRYDHRILSYSIGMGNNGKYGDINTVITWGKHQTACI